MQVIRQLLQLGLALVILLACVNWVFGRGRPGWLRHKMQWTAGALLGFSIFVLIWHIWLGVRP